MAAIRTPEEDLQYNEALRSARAQWEGDWQCLAEYIQPRVQDIGSGARQHGPDTRAHQKLFDSTGVEANQVLARGQLAWMTPKESPWFEFAPDQEFEGDEDIANWYAEVTLAIRRLMANSNFYTEIHECYLDRGGFGTSGLFCDWDPEVDGYHFDCLPLGQYTAAENHRGLVDTVFFEYNWTVRQAAQRFGEDKLPDELKKYLGNAKEMERPERFLHCVYPRELKYRDAQSPFSKDLPVVSRWIHIGSKELITEGGFSTMPFFISRFLRWKGLASSIAPWGWCPAWAALADLRQLNYLEMTMDALADRQVNPPLLVPEYLDARMDLRPGGQTVFDESKGEGGIPREWITGGRYDIGQIRAEEKRQRVNRHFMVQLFEMLAQITKDMTALEVQARMQEKVDQFSPTFDLVTTEKLSPCLKRAFMLAEANGKLPPIPRKLIALDPLTGRPTIPEPNINYTSRLAMAISAAADQGVIRTLNLAGSMAEMRPEVLDNFDFDSFLRTYYRHSGGDPDHLVPVREMEAKRFQRQQAQASAAQAQMILQATGKPRMSVA